jgi:1-acyl-sn-glycerol-3-phosphate acyltransferase
MDSRAKPYQRSTTTQSLVPPIRKRRRSCAMSSQLETLTQINLYDLVSSFGFDKRPLAARLLKWMSIKFARQFAEQMIYFDNVVGREGLTTASHQILRELYVRDVRVHRSEQLPDQGPVLFLSNHPGMIDTISLCAAINRPDLKILASHRPFLESLHNTAKQLIFIDADPAKRVKTIRQVSSHLRHGGSVLSFPAGQIEPDPDVYPGAFESLNNWADSAGTLIRFAPETIIVPVLVRGVIWEKTAHHWLIRLKRVRIEREKLAAALQLFAMVRREVRLPAVQVSFAKPISLDEVGSADSKEVHRVVVNIMRQLIEMRAPDS